MPTTYQQSGVNYNLMDPFKNACLAAGGNNSEVVEFKDFYLVDILEGLGSLNKLADQVYKLTGKEFYYQAGWGNAASILNDLVSLGAKPLTLKLFVAAGSEEWFKQKTRWKELIRGFKDAATYSGARWNGGETQTLVDLVQGSSCVLGGSATSIIKPKKRLITDQDIEEGDRIILFQSSGTHTNGVTLIRAVFANNPDVLIEAIKPKALIYSPLIDTLLTKGVEIHYISHITGHGWRKIMRSRRGFSYVIESIPTPQSIFKKIQIKTSVDNLQMYSDYNMGAGMAVFAPKESVLSIIKIAQQFKIKALDAGFVKKGPRRVNIIPLDISLDGSHLKIR